VRPNAFRAPVSARRRWLERGFADGLALLLSSRIEAARVPEGAVLVDVGCGSGAIAITLQLETGAEVIATDVSQAALEVAATNARRLDAAVRFVACDLLSAVAADSVGVVASNPPYVPLTDRPALQREVRDYEPELALYGGPDGLDAAGQLAEQCVRKEKTPKNEKYDLFSRNRHGGVIHHHPSNL